MRTYLKVGAFLAAGMMLAGHANAAGDAKEGEKVFRKCMTCHMVGDKARNKIGPVLNGIFGRKAGTAEKFRYSKLNEAAGAAGLVWNEETIAAYLPNPNKFLKEFLTKAGKEDQAKGSTRMSFRLSGDEDIANVIAYLKQFSEAAKK